ncbi:Cleavage and polyadenylation specificity factor subunit 1 [Geranomyces michiganensis]|nr:Cleavage and polyadenylation specificity factor subunit 1 [Geranomyces michiganensis]
MASIYSLYKEILPPSGVESCAEARFISPSDVNLIVSRGSVLQVFNVVEDDLIRRLTNSAPSTGAAYDIQVGPGDWRPQAWRLEVTSMWKDVDTLRVCKGEQKEVSTLVQICQAATPFPCSLICHTVNILCSNIFPRCMCGWRVDLGLDCGHMVWTERGFRTATALDELCPPLVYTQGTKRGRKIAKLELHAQFRLTGNVTSIGVVRTSTSVGLLGMDSLLLSFKDAKMSLIEWSPALHNIVTVSIHFYEREEFKKELQTHVFAPEIRVDPQNRCAIMQFYNDRLAILPSKQDTGVQIMDSDDAISKYPFLPSFVVPFSSIESRVRNVVDMVFLYGYFEPTLAILFEPVQTWAGRLATRKDTKCLIVVSLNLTSRSYPILFRVDNLPYNCDKLMAVPSPVGGVVIFCPNALIHVDQTSVPGVACAVNSYYGREALFPPPPTVESIGHTFETKNPLYDAANVSDYKHIGLSLDGAQSFFLNPDTLLTVLRSGEMIQVELNGGEGVGQGWKRRKGGVKRFTLERLGLQTVKPSCGTRFGATGSSAGQLAKVANAVGGVGGTFGEGNTTGIFGYFFVGSRAADSMLIQFNEIHTVKSSQPTLAASGPIAVLPGGDDMDLDDIYGEAIVQTSAMPTAASSNLVETETTRFTFRICDSLICTGPIKDVVVGEPTSYSVHPFSVANEAQADLEVVTCTGESSSGALGVLQRNIRPQIISSLEMGRVTGMWTARCTLPRAKSTSESHNGSTMPMDIDSTDAQRGNGADSVMSSQSNHDTYLFISKDDRTIILEMEKEFVESENNQFYKDGPTVAVGMVLDETCLVQVHQRGIMLFDSDGTCTQNLPMGENEWITSCSILDPYILVLLNIGQIMLFTVDATSRSLRQCRELKDQVVISACLYCDDRAGALFPTMAEYTHSKAKASSDKSQGPHLKAPESPYPHRENDSAPDWPNETLCGAIRDDIDDIYVVEAKNANPIVKDRHDKRSAFGVDDDGITENVTHMDHLNGNGLPHIPERRMWCFIYRADGTLEIFRLPDFEQCYVIPRFDLLSNVAYDQPSEDQRSAIPAVKIEEMVVVNMGRDADHTVPYFIVSGLGFKLTALTTDTDSHIFESGQQQGRTGESDLIIYRAFIYASSEDDGLASESPVAGPGAGPSLDTPPRGDRLAIRFVRVAHDHFGRAAQSYSDTDGDKLHPVAPPVHKAHSQEDIILRSPVSGDDSEHPPDPHLPPIRQQFLKPFERVGLDGSLIYSGVFMSGPRPCWIMMAGTGGVGPQFQTLDLNGKPSHCASDETLADPPLPVSGKNALRVHPQIVDGAVTAFVSMNNVNVRNGFAYVNHEGLLRICQLPAHFTYDAEWPYCRVPLGRDVHKITYHYPTQTYIASTSQPVPFVLSRAQHAAAVAAGVIEVDDPLPEPEGVKRTISPKDDERDSGMYSPHIGAFSIELVSPVTWETSDAIEMDENEHICAMQAVELQSKQTASGRKMFLAVGTAVVRGEDLSTRGRILIYDVISVVPDPQHPHANHRFKRLFVNEEKAPVTALCNVNGYLLASIGSKIIIHTFEDNESLTGVAFIDINMYVNTVCAIKNLILVGDIMKSVCFLGFQEDPPKLALLGKDYHALNVYGLEFMVDDPALSFVVGDGDCNLHVMSYDPYHIQSSSGQKLIRRGDLHIGQHVSKIVRLARLPPHVGVPVVPTATGDTPGSIQTPSDLQCRQQVTMSGTLEGGLLLMVPVTEKLYKRLYGLYSKMVNSLQHPAGLNPRGFRQVPVKSRPTTAAIATPMTGPPGPRLVLDGEILYQYASLSQNQQNELAKGIGSVSTRILDDLLEVLMGVEYF